MGLDVDEFLIRLIKYEKSMFLTACIFLALPSNERRKLALGKWPIIDNFFLTPFIPEMLHILYIFEGSFCINHPKDFSNFCRTSTFPQYMYFDQGCHF